MFVRDYREAAEQADTFAERWPAVEAVEPVAVARQPAGAQRVFGSEPSRTTKHKANRARISCHRQYYYRGHWRYWRCRR